MFEIGIANYFIKLISVLELIHFNFRHFAWISALVEDIQTNLKFVCLAAFSVLSVLEIQIKNAQYAI